MDATKNTHLMASAPQKYNAKEMCRPAFVNMPCTVLTAKLF